MAGESRQANSGSENFAVSVLAEPRRDTRAPDIQSTGVSFRPRPRRKAARPRVKTGTSAPRQPRRCGSSSQPRLPEYVAQGQSGRRRPELLPLMPPHGQALVQLQMSTPCRPPRLPGLRRGAHDRVGSQAAPRRFPCRRTWPSWRALREMQPPPVEELEQGLQLRDSHRRGVEVLAWRNRLSLAAAGRLRRTLMSAAELARLPVLDHQGTSIVLAVGSFRSAASSQFLFSAQRVYSICQPSCSRK